MRTILVHLNDRRRAADLLAPSVAVARHFNGHLIGFNVQTGVPATAAIAMPYSADVIEAVLEAERRETEAIKAVFDETVAGDAFVSEWISVRAPHPDLAAFVAQRSRSVDLVVASQADAAWDLSPVHDFPERLALESGRPVLIVPLGGGFSDMPRRVAIAWNGKREASRAVFDALPLLCAAEQVVVMAIAEQEGEGGDTFQADELGAALARHGVNVSVVTRPLAGSVGETILATADANGAELLVMGAYGHSRFRELVFGGATRHVLRFSKIAALVSH